MRKILFVTILAIALGMILAGCTSSMDSVTGEAKGGKPGAESKVKAQCADGLDNDGDGYCDFLQKKTRCKDGSIPGDLDCASPDDNKEAADCIPVPERCDGFDNDCDGEVDEGLSIECSSASDCGTTGWVGEPYCGADGNVHQDWLSYQCNFPGACSSSCSVQTTDNVYELCDEFCVNGVCVEFSCGDGTCNDGETCSTCSADCGHCDSCSDTDGGGLYMEVRGTVTGYDSGVPYSYTDNCMNATVLNEYGCEGTAWIMYPVTCGDGFDVCVDGECVEATSFCGDGTCDADETCSSCETDCGSCATFCGDGTCDSGETCFGCPDDCGLCPDFCKDSDGGFVVDVQGTVSGNDDGVGFVYTDYCHANTTILREYECSGMSPMNSPYDCNDNVTGGYCSNGACVALPPL